MKKIVFAVLLAAALVFAYSCGNDTHDAEWNVTQSDITTESSKFDNNTIYSYMKEDKSIYFQFVSVGADTINFRFVDNSPEVVPTDAIAMHTSYKKDGDNICFDYNNEFMFLNVEISKQTVIVNTDDEMFKGEYSLMETPKSDYSYEIKPFPCYEKDDNTDGFEMDKTLAAAIRRSENLPEDAILTRDMLENISELYVWEDTLVTLKGIEYLTNLERFATDVSYITDIEPMSKLKKLKTVYLGSGYIRNIPDLSGMDSLEEFLVTGNLITDISPILSAKKLSIVNLSSNRITSIEPLKNMHNLTMLSIEGNCITDFGTLSDNKDIIAAIEEAGYKFKDFLTVENRAKEIIDEIITEQMTDLEKEYTIYKYVIDNMEYEVKSRKQRPLGYYGIMEWVGVCGDYADTVALLCRTAGLDVICINSDTHAWNMICLDGIYYHLDATWDDGGGDMQYFNRSGKYMLEIQDHKFDLYSYPVAEEMDSLVYANLLG